MSDETVIICNTGECGLFADDLHGPCARGCGAVVHWRPHCPEPSTKICFACFQKEDDGEASVGVTPETLRDVLQLKKEGKL
jgi:hypothetical protein